MMKVGIITWFTYENYGTKLQAIALQRYLKNKKLNPVLLNFAPPETEGGEAPSSFFLKYKDIRNIKVLAKKIKNKGYYFVEKIGRRKYKQELIERSKKLNDIILDKCVLSEKIVTVNEYINVCNDMDCLIFGSDQIWNPNWFHPYYYANYKEIVVNKMAYAPSIGVTEIGDSQKEKYRKSLETFSKIGVREKTGKQIIQELYEGTVENVVDPTLLHTKEEWKQILDLEKTNTDTQEKYICVYFLSENAKHWKAVYSLAKREKLKVKIIPYVGTSFLRKGDVIASTSVQDFISIIENAQYVITDSFHATVFSVIFNREFYTLERFDSKNLLSQNSRIYDFLSEIELEKRILPFNTSKIDYSERINYNIINGKLENLIKKSKEFLNDLVEVK